MSCVHYTLDNLLGYLQSFCLPSLSAEDREYLDGPITSDELDYTLRQFAKHKTPGLDGLPIDCYLAHTLPL